MPLVNGDHFIAEFWTRQFNQYALNVRRYRIVAGLSDDGNDDVLFINRLANRAATLYVACLPATAYFYGVRVRPIQSDPPLTLEKVEVRQGTHSLKPLPLQVSVVAHGTTGLFGRRNKVRSYIAFPPLDALTGSAGIDPDYFPYVNPLAQFLTVGGSLSPGLPSIFIRGVTTGTPGGVRRDIMSSSVSREFGTMRTRSQIGANLDSPPFE